MAIAEAWFLCPVTHFCVVFEVCIWIIVQLEDPTWPIIRFLQSQSLIDFVSVGI